MPSLFLLTTPEDQGCVPWTFDFALVAPLIRLAGSTCRVDQDCPFIYSTLARAVAVGLPPLQGTVTEVCQTGIIKPMGGKLEMGLALHMRNPH